MPYRASACALAVLLAAAPARAGESYAIRFKMPVVGETVRVEKEETRSIHTTTQDGLGRTVMDRQEKEVETLIYTEQYRELSPDGKRLLLRREYEKAQLKQGRNVRNYPYHRRTVFIRLDGGGKFDFSYPGGLPLSAEDAKPLDHEFNNGDEKFRVDNLLPAKPVPVGADWVVDMNPLVQDFSRTGRFTADGTWAKGSGHLNKATPMGGAQFGQIHYRMDVPILSLSPSPQERYRAISGSKATFELTFDMCIDGSRPDATFLATASVKAGADLPQIGGLPGRLTYTHKSDTKEVRKLVVAK